MGKIFRTIKYGSAKTRFLMLAILLLLLGGIGTAAAGIFMDSLIMMLVGAGAVLIAAVLYFACFENTLIDDMASEDGEAADDAEIPEQDAAGGREAAASGRAETNGAAADRTETDGRRRAAAADDDSADSEGGPEAGEEKVRRNRAEIEVINNAHGLKKLLRKYKIKNYVPVVIDSSKSMAVSKTPAFCWERKGAFNFLLLEAEARTVSLMATEFLHVTYQRNVPEDEPEAYEALRELPQDVFASVLPTFNTEIGRMGQTIYTKNLYVLGRDVAVTPRSMRELRKKYRFKYRIFESLDVSGDYSDYFKKAYEARVMWTDNVISQKEYQEQISEILQKMAEDDDIIKYDFLDNLDLMIRHRLITDEFAAYYKARRSERELKALNRKSGKKR